MSREERLAREVLELVERFHDRRSDQARRRRARHMLRGVVPDAVKVLALLSIARGLGSRRRRLLPFALAYVDHRRRGSRRRKHR